MGLFSSNNSKSNFPWIIFTEFKQLEDLIQQNETIVVFKHSTRCSISSMVLRQFEREMDVASPIKFLFLDLIANRNLSNQIEQFTKIIHQSPQVIVLQNKQVIYNASHEQISASKIMSIV